MAKVSPEVLEVAKRVAEHFFPQIQVKEMSPNDWVGFITVSGCFCRGEKRDNPGKASDSVRGCVLALLARQLQRQVEPLFGKIVVTPLRDGWCIGSVDIGGCICSGQGDSEEKALEVTKQTVILEMSERLIGHAEPPIDESTVTAS